MTHRHDDLNADILIVDDTLANLQILSKILKAKGKKVRSAKSGAIAQTMISARKPDLILLDINMPEMDGITLCKILKEDKRTKDIPIIFLSALDDVHTKIRAFEAGGVDYISKPFEQAEVLARVQNHLSLQMTLRQLAESNAKRKRSEEELQKEAAERKRTEDALKESEELFRVHFEYGNIGMAITSVEKGWLRVNPRLLDMLGYTEEELYATTWAEITHPDDLAPDIRQFERILAGEIDAYDMDKRFFRKDGTVFHANLTVSCFRNPDASVRFVLASLQDINDRKRFEKELRKAKEAADAANRIKSEFLANMSHEIRTPMNSVMGFLSLVLDDPALPEHHRRYLETAHASSKSLLHLINDILDVSKLESGKLELEQIGFDLRTMLEETIKTLDISARGKGLFLKLIVDESLHSPVIGDPSRLKQILINLVGNAVKFTEKGGITVTIKPADNKGMMLFSIKDTGIGIPAERLSHIFDPFTQGDGSTARRFGGTGLGTTISKQLTELMGGEIWAESEEGKGSVFYFTVYMEPADHIFKTEIEPFTCDLGRCYKILIADDMEENIMLAKIRLEQTGHTVMEAKNGLEAVESFKAESPDLILMDVHMPEMDGLEAVRMIRQLENGSDSRVPVLALTASVMKEDRHKCLEAGMDAVVGKPIDFKELFSAIDQVVPQWKEDETQKSDSHSYHKAASYHEPVEFQIIEGVDFKAGLARMGGDHKAYRNLLAKFFKNNEKYIEKMKKAFENGDKETAKRLAHNIKGVAGNLAIDALQAAALDLETAFRQEQENEISQCLDHFTRVFSQIMNSLEAFLNVSSGHKDEYTSSAGSVDMHTVKALLDKLKTLLEEDDMESLECISEIKQIAAGVDLIHELEKVEVHLDQYDFQKALDALKQINILRDFKL